MIEMDLQEQSSSLTFSIITVTYNAEKVLERTLRSVQSQTYPFVQHVLIDGKSSDGTINLIEQYKRENLVFISEKDKGLYDAMNKGILLAEGDYILFLNAGDTFHSTTLLEDVAQTIPKGTLPDVLYGETDIVDDEGKFLRKRRLSAPEVLTWKSFQKGMLVCHQSFFTKSSLAKENLYNTSYHFSADFDGCIRILKQAKKIHNTHLIISDYLNEGLTTKNHLPSLVERFRIMIHHYGLFCTLYNHLYFVFRSFIKR